MHLINDENGNMVPHGHDHEHDHVHSHEHSHGCSSCSEGECGGNCTEEVVALLNYMLSHNEHHAQELDQMADNLSKLGMEDAATMTFPTGLLFRASQQFHSVRCPVAGK